MAYLRELTEDEKAAWPEVEYCVACGRDKRLRTARFITTRGGDPLCRAHAEDYERERLAEIGTRGAPR